ncbi:MAG: DinB family protein [Candidatus Xenobia bacterium]
MIPDTLRELFTYNDYARRKLLDACEPLDDAALDTPFAMGEGSLRKTLCHLVEAEAVWLQRWKGVPVTVEEQALSVVQAREQFLAVVAEREVWLSQHDDFTKTFRYARPSWMEPGPELELPYDVTMLHILNHGPHHHAQALNMLKRLGQKLPTLDYIVMRIDGHLPELDRATLQRYLAHNDWAWHQVHQAAPEAARHREFPIGPGTLYRILRHLADAPDWWLDSMEGNIGPFPEMDESATWEALKARYEAAARRRDRALETGDLAHRITIRPRPGIERQIPLGVALLQLCVHSTHHRAQALNMLRHSGVTVPGLDVNVWYRALSPR